MSGAEITPRIGKKIHYRVFVTTPSGERKDVTFFRGAPTEVGSLAWADPFSESSATLTFPAITIRERVGVGSLSWLIPESNVDIVFYEDGEQVDSWEGYFVSEDFAVMGRTITCKGALYQADNYLAAPYFPVQPVPYELLIRDALSPSRHPGLRLMPLTVEWPEGWDQQVPTQSSVASYMRPWGVRPGDNWTGITSRATGSWENILTGFVQTLLGVMYTSSGGQWTVVKLEGRRPVLRVREALTRPSGDTWVVHAGTPGVETQLSRDHSQSRNVWYGRGTDLSGTTFSGMQVTSDGETTYYDPFAALPYVFPDSPTNPRLLPHVMRKEMMLQFPQGVDELAARRIAQFQAQRNADPGFTGNITLTIDPTQNGAPRSRFLIRAGDTILVKGVAGADLLFHISAVTVTLSGESVALTVDTKFRDALTVDEVMARTRDALDPVRLLQVGKYANTIQDLIKPWSYAEGSGVVPSGGSFDATPLFTKLMPNDARFPWTEYTTKYPPKKYPQYYIKVPKRNANATKNWSGAKRNGISMAAIPVKMAQSGTIRLSQIAAYDANGNVKPVYYHVGVYGSTGVNPNSMPMMPAASKKAKVLRSGYAAGQRYPFFEGAFERTKPDGTQQSDLNYLPADGIDMAIAWGNYYEPAGYSPGLYSQGGAKTGLLIDESPWSFDTSAQPGFDKYSAEKTAKNASAGMMYIMIYCDDSDTDTYFLGRFFVSVPGAT